MSQTALEVTSLLSDLEGASWLNSKSRAAWKKHEFFQSLVWVVSEKHIKKSQPWFFFLIYFFPCIFVFFDSLDVSIRGCDFKKQPVFQRLAPRRQGSGASTWAPSSVRRGNAAESKGFGGRNNTTMRSVTWVDASCQSLEVSLFFCVL